jgi:hypothetical protein
MESATDALSILYCFIEKTALTAPVVKMFDTSVLTTLQVAPPPGVIDAYVASIFNQDQRHDYQQ